MRRLSLVVVCLGSLASAAVARAQEEGRHAGSWGFEGGISAAPTLLHFRSATSAWVFGVSASYTRNESERPNFAGGGTTKSTDESAVVDLRVGLRGYRAMASRVERYWTVSGIVGFEHSSAFGNGPRVGGAGEMGAAYFFNPRVSLGGSGELSAVYSAMDGGDLESSRNSLAVRIVGFRLVGAVFF